MCKKACIFNYFLDLSNSTKIIVCRNESQNQIWKFKIKKFEILSIFIIIFLLFKLS